MAATLGCVSINDKDKAAQGRYGVLGFQMSSLLVPTFGIYGFGIQGGGSGGSGSGGAYAFGARFGIDYIVEYNETNGVEGYQPGIGATFDKAIKIYSMADLLRSQKWSTPTDDITNVGGNTTVHKITTQLKASDNIPFTVTWGAMVSTDEVVAGDKTKVVLTPNSLKTVFDLQNFKYTSEGSRMAIGTIVLSAGATAKWSATSQSKDGDRPNEVTANQGVYGIGASASSNTNGYFSFQKFVQTTDAGTTASTRTVTLTAGQDFTTETDSAISKGNDEASVSLKRTWFTVNERVTNFNWDPSLGASETQENNVPTTNSANKISMTLAAVAFVVTALLL